MPEELRFFTKPNTDLEVGQTGTAVRRGREWADGVKIDELAPMTMSCDPNHPGHPFGSALIVGVATLPFNELTDDVIAVHHKAALRTREALLADMAACYPDFSPVEPVTVLTFKRVT